MKLQFTILLALHMVSPVVSVVAVSARNTTGSSNDSYKLRIVSLLLLCGLGIFLISRII
jgi:hypothetical protein